MVAGVVIESRATVRIGPLVEIGAGTRLLPGTIIEGRSRIGEGCRIGPNVRLVDVELPPRRRRRPAGDALSKDSGVNKRFPFARRRGPGSSSAAMFASFTGQPPVILSGTASNTLSTEICTHLEITQGGMEICAFADEETFVKILDNVRGADVFVVQGTSRPANENIMQLLLLIDAAKRASAARVTAVVPYFGYAPSGPQRTGASGPFRQAGRQHDSDGGRGSPADDRPARWSDSGIL
jgi:hypothetical protein